MAIRLGVAAAAVTVAAASTAYAPAVQAVTEQQAVMPREGTPTVPAPSSSPLPSASATPVSLTSGGGGGCGFLDFGCQAGHAIDSWFAGLARSAINPLFGLLGQALLSTPQIGGFSTVHSLWAESLAIAASLIISGAGGPRRRSR